MSVGEKTFLATQATVEAIGTTTDEINDKIGPLNTSASTNGTVVQRINSTNNTVATINTTVNTINSGTTTTNSSIGATNNSGGTTSAGTIFAKLNALLTIISRIHIDSTGMYVK